MNEDEGHISIHHSSRAPHRVRPIHRPGYHPRISIEYLVLSYSTGYLDFLLARAVAKHFQRKPVAAFPARGYERSHLSPLFPPAGFHSLQLPFSRSHPFGRRPAPPWGPLMPFLSLRITSPLRRWHLASPPHPSLSLLYNVMDTPGTTFPRTRMLARRRPLQAGWPICLRGSV